MFYVLFDIIHNIIKTHIMKITIILCILVVCSEFKAAVNWGTYQYTQRSLSTTPTSNRKSIVFSHPDIDHRYIKIESQSSVSLVHNSYNNLQYKVGTDAYLNVLTHHKRINISMRLLPNIEKQTSFKLTLKLSQISESQLKKIDKICLKKDKNETLSQFQCKLNPKSPHFDFSFVNQEQSEADASIANNVTKQEENHKQKILKFMETHNILAVQPSSEIDNYEMVNLAISNAIGSLCIDQQHVGEQMYKYLGFCYRGNYDYKFTPLVISLLADYDAQFADTIYQDYLTSIQARVMYPSEEEEAQGIMPIPEHLDTFLKFVKIDDPLRQSRMLNALFVKCMLNQLQSLHEQVNYRQAKKLHPYLMQMLTQSWKPSDKLSSYKSIYAQSLTEDFNYHAYGQKLHQSITKVSWLFKAIDTYSLLQVAYYKNFLNSETLREHLQESFSLLNLLNKFMNEDQNAKKGNYYDVIEVKNGMKFYSKSLGYGNILPYLYAGSVFPVNAFKSLLTEYGLKSANTQSSNHPRKYRYRGDIHLYFNYQILNGITQKTKADQPINKNQILKTIALTWNSIRINLYLNYKTNNKIYTSWTSSGKGKQSIPWLQIVSVLFLKEYQI